MDKTNDRGVIGIVNVLQGNHQRIVYNRYLVDVAKFCCSYIRAILQL